MNSRYGPLTRRGELVFTWLAIASLIGLVWALEALAYATTGVSQ